MQITLTSVMVLDQDKALAFYTDVIGFEKKHDIPMGGPHRWLTVTAPEGAHGVELLLEPIAFPPARDFQKALYDAGMPATAFITHDIAAEYARLQAKGVTFRGKPTDYGMVQAVLFEDGCGNLINLVQPVTTP